MKSDEPQPKRRYRMQARAKAAEETGLRILDVTFTLLKERAYDHIPLQEVAKQAGVSLQTVLRRFGSKEGLVKALLERDPSGFQAMRAEVAPGDVEGAVRVIMQQYEVWGDGIMRHLNLEERLPELRTLLDFGRARHREWVAQVFAPFLPAPDAEMYQRKLALFITATDVYTWKLLRRDQGLDEAETALALRDLLDSLIASN